MLLEMTRRLLPFLLVLAGSAQATVAPFGISLEATSAELQAMDSLYVPSLKAWVTDRPPRPDTRFEMVVINHSPRYGVCAVTGMQRLTSDDTGAGARDALDALRTELERAYGPAVPLDRLNAGSRLTGERQWLAGIAARERWYGASWHAELHDLPEELNAVILNVSTGKTTREVFVSVQYRAAAYDLCMADLKQPAGR